MLAAAARAGPRRAESDAAGGVDVDVEEDFVEPGAEACSGGASGSGLFASGFASLGPDADFEGLAFGRLALPVPGVSMFVSFASFDGVTFGSCSVLICSGFVLVWICSVLVLV